jgi:hypothetical protein
VNCNDSTKVDFNSSSQHAADQVDAGIHGRQLITKATQVTPETDSDVSCSGKIRPLLRISGCPPTSEGAM